MSTKKVIVVTGGTRGIGQCFCDYFLSHNCNVIFTGTSEDSVAKAIAHYSEKYTLDSFLGLVADVRSYEDCQRIIEKGIEKFQNIHIYICNAGIDIPHKQFHQLPVDSFNKAIDINLKGPMNCSHTILEYFTKIGNGGLYLMEGFGSDQRVQIGMTSYGTSKYAIRYLAKSLANEYDSTGIIIGALSPGMVATTLLTDSLLDLPLEQRKKTIRIYNILADHPERVVDFLASGVLNNKKNKAKIHWLTPQKIGLRFLTARFKKRQIINENEFINQ